MRLRWPKSPTSANTASSGVSASSIPPRWARPAAIGWTALILSACFLPGSEIPDLKIPLLDKWAHFILFGVFAFLWLLSFPSRRPARLLWVFLISVAFGYSVELLQGALHRWLGRSYSGMDVVADAVGSALGVGAFYFYARRHTALHS